MYSRQSVGCMFYRTYILLSINPRLVKSPNPLRSREYQQQSRTLCASMQNARAARREGGVVLRKDRRKTISLSSDRCRVALDTPLVEVGLYDNESLDVAIRRGVKEGKSVLTIVRISVGDREANRLPSTNLTSRESRNRCSLFWVFILLHDISLSVGFIISSGLIRILALSDLF